MQIFQTTLKTRINFGFTLIEMMITAALLALMVSFVVPLGGIAEDAKLDYLNQRMYSTAILAKSEAIKRSEKVSVCQSSSGTVCEFGRNWADGWIVFVNLNGNNNFESNLGEEILRTYNPVSSPIDISWSGDQVLTFSASGMPNLEGGFAVCSLPKKVIPKRLVGIAKTGLISKYEGEPCLKLNP